MKTLDDKMLRSLQMTELECLKEVDRICVKNGIPYNIIAGTMLGAVRHKGFIPWDDDADVALLRPEYERFKEALKRDLDTDRFYFQDHSETEGYRWGYGKLRRKDSLFLREFQEHMPYEQGVFIDVFPLDPVPESKAGRTVWAVRCFLIRKALWAKVGKVADKSALKRLVFRCMDAIPEKTILARLDRMIDRSRRIKSRWVRILMFPTPNKEYGYLRKWYLSSAPIIFEGAELAGVTDADEYLSFKFGDYMTLPPEEQRKTHPVSDIYMPDEKPDRLLAEIKERGCALYGTGYVAETVWKIFEEKNMTDAVRFFVETKKTKDFFHGVPVYSLKDAPLGEGPVVCIAVHDAVKDEIRNSLKSVYNGQAEWIYPYLKKWAYGDVLYEREIPLKELIAAQAEENFWITVRYAALAEHLETGERGTAAEIYLKTQSAFTDSKTAEARLERLYGFSPDFDTDPIVIDTEYRVIDGLHRAAAALCFGKKTIKCAVVRASDMFDKLLTDANRITPEAQRRAGLTEEESAYLGRVKKELLGKVLE